MDPIALGSSPLGALAIVVFVLAALAFGVSFYFASRIDKAKANGRAASNKFTNLFFGSFFGGTALVLVGFVLTLSAEDSKRSAQNAEAQDEINSVYGLNLSESEVGALRYPTEAPDESFKVLGSIEQREQVEGVQFVERTVYLVWADDELGLAVSEDGENFEPLPAASN